MAIKGYYSIVQFCPDAERDERLNVGILLFSPEHRYIKALATKDSSRLEQVFLIDPKRYVASIEGFLTRICQSISRGEKLYIKENIESYIRVRPLPLRITAPQSILLEKSFDEELEQLYKELV